MRLVALSLNHRVTSLRDRELVAFDRELGERFLVQIKERCDAREAFLVSTCNRTEVYLVLEPDANVDHAGELVLELLRESRGFEPGGGGATRNFFLLHDAAAVGHLFRVAAGLESQIVGESQVVGQVKTSMDWARSANSTGRVVNRLWERALRVGKRVRSETALGLGALSASYAALELARKVFGSLKGRRVLIIGTGEIGVLALENLRGVPLGRLTITNRTRSRADELAARFGGDVSDFDRLADAILEADLVISSTGARDPIVRLDDMRAIRAKRGGSRALLVVDLAVPRDFEPACGQLDHVFLKSLDDLNEIVLSNLDGRRSEIPRAEAIVESEISTFLDWMRALDVEPTIRRLREIFHEIRKDELGSARRSMGDETYRLFDRFSRRLVNRLLHAPSENLRRHASASDPEVVSLIHELLTKEIPHPNEQNGDEGERG